MGVWGNIRRLGFSGPVQGVQNPGSVEVITPLQGVQIVDDAAWAVAPPPVPHGLIQTLMPGFAGEFSGIEIRPGGQGLWILNAFGEAAGIARSMAIWQDNDQVVTAGITVLPFVAGVAPGVLSEAVFRAIRVAAIPGGGGAEGRTDFAIDDGRQTPLALYLVPGSRVFIVNILVNSTDLAVYTWRDVPSRFRA